MSFFDKKEDVIHIEITQYGKYLLSKGKFRPVYYAFFDDNVLYDSRWADVTEAQNDAEGRIQENTPQLDVQYVYSGIETEFKKAMKLIRTNQAKVGEEKIQPTAEKNFALSMPLGNSSLVSTKSPAWQINSLIGKFDNITHYTTGSQPTSKIPQIDATIEYEVGVERGEPKPRYEYRGASDAEFFADGTQLRVWENRIILDVVENNVPFSSENFDIEVFLVEEEDVSGNIKTPGVIKSSKREILTPLNFMLEEDNIRNEILQDSPKLSQQEIVIDPGYVDYFFELEADFEIDGDLLRLARSEDKSKSLFTDKRYGTPRQREMIRDLYGDGFPDANARAGREFRVNFGDDGGADPNQGDDDGTGRRIPSGDRSWAADPIEGFDPGGPVTAVDDGEVC